MNFSPFALTQFHAATAGNSLLRRGQARNAICNLFAVAALTRFPWALGRVAETFVETHGEIKWKCCSFNVNTLAWTSDFRQAVDQAGKCGKFWSPFCSSWSMLMLRRFVSLLNLKKKFPHFSSRLFWQKRWWTLGRLLSACNATCKRCISSQWTQVGLSLGDGWYRRYGGGNGKGYVNQSINQALVCAQAADGAMAIFGPSDLQLSRQIETVSEQLNIPFIKVVDDHHPMYRQRRWTVGGRENQRWITFRQISTLDTI